LEFLTSAHFIPFARTAHCFPAHVPSLAGRTHSPGSPSPIVHRRGQWRLYLVTLCRGPVLLVSAVGFASHALAVSVKWVRATSASSNLPHRCAAKSAAQIARISLAVPTTRPESPRSRVLRGPNHPVVSYHKSALAIVDSEGGKRREKTG
jgi:hypothetical protein